MTRLIVVEKREKENQGKRINKHLFYFQTLSPLVLKRPPPPAIEPPQMLVVSLQKSLG